MHAGWARHPVNRQNFNRFLGRGSDIVTGLIGGMAFGGGVGSALTGGIGLVPGAIIGALVGVAATERASRRHRDS